MLAESITLGTHAFLQIMMIVPLCANFDLIYYKKRADNLAIIAMCSSSWFTHCRVWKSGGAMGFFNPQSK